MKNLITYEQFVNESKEITHVDQVFSNKLKQKTRDDLTTFFLRRFEKKHPHEIRLDRRKDLWNDAIIKKVNVKNIIPSQDYLNQSKIDDYLNGEEKGFPLGVSVPNSDKVVLFDGHHRVASDILSNKSEVEIKVIPTFGLFKNYQK